MRPRPSTLANTMTAYAVVGLSRDNPIITTKSRLLFGRSTSLGEWVRMFVADSAGRGISFLPHRFVVELL
jgi:hypothetical protein